jgi:hypothetical protein
MDRILQPYIFIWVGGMMDTSKEYIEMCRKAKKIQKLRPSPSRLGTESIEKQSCIIYKHTKTRGWHLAVWKGLSYLGKDWVWLPRQDQLQEMVECEYVDRDLLSRDLNEFSHSYFKTDDGVSWEMFWLAFVMKERWRKVWNGKEWQG